MEGRADPEAKVRSSSGGDEGAAPADAGFFKKPPPFKLARVPGVQMPAAKRLTQEEVFGSGDVPDCELLLKHFLAEGRLAVDTAVRIMEQGMAKMGREPALLRIHGKTTVVGDIHGQFYDLVEIFKIGGHPSETRYLFMGDYVDRGYFSVECVLYLWSLKIKYPKNILLLRGNHECRHLTQYFTYHSECTYKYNDELYEKCMVAFDFLPLAAVLDDRYLVLHGGLSPHIQTLEDIASIDRFTEPEPEGAMCDILWSDPAVDFGAAPIDEAQVYFSQNDARGCSYYFSYLATCKFLERNKLLCLIRAHEVQDAGFRIYDRNVETGFPAMICIFSAPNYLDVYGNKGGVLLVDGEKMNIKQFNSSPHPYWLPNFMDCFTWSIPFIGEKVTEILHAVAQSSAEDEEQDEAMARWQPKELIEKSRSQGQIALGADTAESRARREGIKRKIRAIGRMSKVFRVIREEQEHVVKLKSLLPNAKMPVDTLLHGVTGLEDAIRTHTQSFASAKEADAMNEKLPMATTLSNVVPSKQGSPVNGITATELANRKANHKLDAGIAAAIAKAERNQKRGGGGGRRQ